MKIDNVILNISENLKELRKERNLTQLEVSHYLNMERKGYQKIEYGTVKDIKLSTILKILAFYEIEFKKLITR